MDAGDVAPEIFTANITKPLRFFKVAYFIAYYTGLNRDPGIMLPPTSRTSSPEIPIGHFFEVHNILERMTP